MEAMFWLRLAKRASPPGKTCQAPLPSDSAKTRSSAERMAIAPWCQMGVCDSGI